MKTKSEYFDHSPFSLFLLPTRTGLQANSLLQWKIIATYIAVIQGETARSVSLPALPDWQLLPFRLCRLRCNTSVRVALTTSSPTKREAISRKCKSFQRVRTIKKIARTIKNYMHIIRVYCQYNKANVHDVMESVKKTQREVGLTHWTYFIPFTSW